MDYLDESFHFSFYVPLTKPAKKKKYFNVKSLIDKLYLVVATFESTNPNKSEITSHLFTLFFVLVSVSLEKAPFS